MGVFQVLRRLGPGYAAVATTDQIACDATAMTITPTGGASARLPDLLATVQCVTPRQFKTASDPDDTASIQAAINYAAANNAFTLLPGGNYATSRTITLPSNAKLVGAGMGFTQIIPSQTSSPAFSTSGAFVGLSDITINWNGASVSTGATGLLISGGSNAFIDRVTVDGSDICFEVTNASLVFFRQVFGNIIKTSGLFVHGTPNTASGAASGVVTDCQIDGFIFAAGGVADPTTGVGGIIHLADAVESFVAVNGECLFGKIPLVISSTDTTPSDRKMPQFNKFTNVFCDSNAQGATIKNCTTTEFESCWFSTGRSGSGFPGVDLDACDSISFNHCNLFSCGLHGARVNPGAKNTVFNLCKAQGNGASVAAAAANGIHFVAGTSDFTVSNCIGNNGLFGVGQQGCLAYVEAGASDRYGIVNNRVAYNATPAGIFDGGTGTNKILLGNF